MRAGPVMGPEKRIDSKVALRRSGELEAKASRLLVVALDRENKIVS